MHSALLEFDDLGLLRATQIPRELTWMTSTHIDVLLKVLMSGTDGLPRRRTRKFGEARLDALRQLELRDYVQWERDRRGQLAFLCLTWKGEEATQMVLKVAQHGQRAMGPEEASTCSS